MPKRSSLKKANGRGRAYITAVFRKVPQGYIGYVKELPGANTQGKTLKETRKNLREAVVMVLEANRTLSKSMDEEQLQLGSSRKFWKLVEGWRKEKTISRAELEKKLARTDELRAKKRSGGSALKSKRATLLHR